MENKSASYRGCLLGLAVGDAMGCPIDKKTWDEICADYGPNGLLGYAVGNYIGYLMFNLLGML